MNSTFERPLQRGRLHDQVTRQLARRVIQGEQLESLVAFPNETDLAQQLGVSRTILRESMKVLVDKGMVEMRPKFGTRARPRSSWNLLDPDILAWQAEVHPDARFLRDLCEVRLAIEPTAAGFAAVRATEEEVSLIEQCWRGRELQAQTGDFSGDEVIDLDLRFHTHQRRNLQLGSLAAQRRGDALDFLTLHVGLVAIGKRGEQGDGKQGALFFGGHGVTPSRHGQQSADCRQ